MDKDRQIEEMAKVICRRFRATDDVTSRDLARAVYDAGYRKQSKGEWVVEGVYFKTMKCSVCNNTANSIYDKTPFCPNCGAKMTKGDVD